MHLDNPSVLLNDRLDSQINKIYGTSSSQNSFAMGMGSPVESNLAFEVKKSFRYILVVLSSLIIDC